MQLFPSITWLWPLSLLLIAQNVDAGLMINPVRVVLDGNKVSEELILINTAENPTSYRLRFMPQRQKTRGGYEINPKDLEVLHDAEPLLRLSPRQITIAPNEKQRIRLRINRRALRLDSGEYRTHLLFEQLPPAEPSPETGGEKEASLNIRTIVSISIPVIVRVGDEHQIESKITQMDIRRDPNGKLMMELGLSQQGNISSYGRVEIDLQIDNQAPIRIGGQSHVAIYREVEERIVNIPLHADNIPNKSKIVVRYVGDEEFKGRVWDEVTFLYQQ